MLTVRGYDERHRLARARRTRTFTGMTDSAIAEEVAVAAGLRARVTDSGEKVDYVVQHNQTDLEFLHERARMIGYEVRVEEGTLHFRPPPHTGPAAARLYLGKDLTEFTPRLRALPQATELSVRGWNMIEKSAVVGTVRAAPRTSGATTGPWAARQAFGVARTTDVGLRVPDKGRAEQMAEGRFAEMALGYVQGEAEGFGRPDLRAGQVVDIQGAGRTFSGPYYVTSVTHVISADRGYRTSFEVRREST
jgi:phage protein D